MDIGKKPIKEKRLLIILILASILAVISVLTIFLSKKGTGPKEVAPPERTRTIEEILKDLTAPAGGEPIEIPEEIRKSLTAPERGLDRNIPQEVLRKLTAPK